MPKYKLKPGAKHYLMLPMGKHSRLVQVTGGQTIELSEARAAGIMDKLVQAPVTGEEAEAIKVEEGRKNKEQKDNRPQIVATDTKGLYNVINKTTNKPINPKPVSLTEAEEIAGYLFDG